MDERVHRDDVRKLLLLARKKIQRHKRFLRETITTSLAAPQELIRETDPEQKRDGAGD
jgi:hypothetical protein